MLRIPSANARPAGRTRYHLVAFWFGTLLAVFFGLRLALFFKFGPTGASPLDMWLTFLVGLHRDAYVALLLMLPLLFWFFIMPNRWFAATWHRALFRFACFAWWLAEIFALMAEFFFFEEFRSRFNTVAVDYVLYPTEVFINIWDSYPVVTVVILCSSLSVVWVWIAHRLFREMWLDQSPPGKRFAWLLGAAALVAILTPTVKFKGAHAGTDRTLNEIANNGAIAFACAAWTHHLDYAAFYKTIPKDEAYVRVRRLLASTNATFFAEGRTLRRKVDGDLTRPRLNVVIFLEESLGSEFWGCLGRTNTCTPEMDKLATGEGMLFTDLYACGNRTVRGFEGVLSSFPPLPGDSIVKRDLSDNVETIARVLKRDGYNTIFLYGGRGLFDGMRSFTTRNGYDRFIEQKHFDQPTFTTIWGVCDEDIFKRALEEFRELSRQDKPFLGTILSVSNHKPYTYPAGRIPEDPNERQRENAVKYSDWCLGQFFKLAKQEPFWTNTIFAVVADHGARVYGSQRIPIHSYEIPMVILGPAAVPRPARVSAPGGSLDVSPTILGLLGRPYETTFFGRDLLRESPAQGRALLNHNRDIGLFTQNRLVVLGLKRDVEFYEGDPKVAEITPMKTPAPRELEMEQDTIALYQVADDLYVNRRYRIDAIPDQPAKLPIKER